MKQSVRVQAAILILFFFSGAAGLIYEVVWQRMLVLVFGNTTSATTTIIAAFMGGLALGSFCLGKLADKYSKPLRLFAYLEVGIGVFAVLFPFILSGISVIYISISQHLTTTPYLINLIKFALCFMVLLIPSFLMGGTLPIISKFFVSRLEKLSLSVGSLYGSNTLGGAIGAFTAGFLLINWLGVRETAYVATALNILIAGVAFGLSLVLVSASPAAPRRREGRIEETDRKVYPKHISTIILVVYALSGFCALAYEVLWTRLLVFFLGNTTYAFTTMLTTFLLGLALGSLIFARFLDKGKHLLVMLALLEVFIGLFAILSVWEFSSLRDMILGLYGRSWYDATGIRYIGAFLIMFIPTLLLGIAFPLANKIYVNNLTKLGHSIGNLYSANTMGAVLGSFVAGFMLIPIMGITGSIILIAVINLILGAAVLLFDLLARHRIKWATAGVVAILLVVVVTTATVPSVELQKLSPGQKQLFYREGSSATVVVLQYYNGMKELRVNGISEVGTDNNSLRTFHMLGHLPLLLHENPQKVLVIAFGAGIASGAVAEHPLQEIDAVEISPEVIEASEYLRHENQAVLDDPRLNLIIEDGRNYLLRTTSRYDVITSDSTHPMASDSWLLYTREFYELCREKLNPGGIMAQWLPLHGLAPVDYKTILKTFQTVFPDTTLWSANQYTLIIGSKEGLTIDYSHLAQRLQDENIKEDLQQFGLSDPIAFLGSFIMGKEAIAEFTLGVPINTDNRPFVQFAERRKEAGTYDRILAELSLFRESVLPLLTNMGDEASTIESRLQR
jgi:spermidine synthase